MALADVTKLLPVRTKKNGSSRPGTKRSGFHAFVIHETANENEGADAEMHYKWLTTEKPPASFHFCVDSEQAIQFIPEDEIAWHLGDGADDPIHDEAFYTLSVELCVNSKDGFDRVCRRAAKLVADAMFQEHVAPAQDMTVRKHGSYPETTHKFCPLHLSKGDWGWNWADFNAAVRAAYAQRQGILVTPGIKHLFIQAQALRVREGPGTQFPQAKIDGILRFVYQGQNVEIDEIVIGRPVYDDPRWGHLSNGEGFISLAYCTE